MENFGGNRMLQQQANFKMLRRLHEHNLENTGLNNLSEAFQNFVTRAKFFSIGRLRRTWSHSAVEFMKYRRLLPMIVGDEHDPGSVFDDFTDFAVSDPAAAVAGLSLPLTARPAAGAAGERHAALLQQQQPQDERKISVGNVSARATKSQLQCFFSKFGKVHHCQIPMDKCRHAMVYATLPKQSRKWHGTCVITNAQSAVKARKAPSDELLFYGQQMHVGLYISTAGIGRRRTTSSQLASSPRTQECEQALQDSSGRLGTTHTNATLSRTSSSSSLASTASNNTLSSAAPLSGLALAELPDKALVVLLHFVGPLDRIRFERVSKQWLEASAKAWLHSRCLSFGEDKDLLQFFSSLRPLRHSQLRAILRRCGVHLNAMSFAGVKQLLDPQQLGELGTLCPNLEEIDLTGVVAPPAALRALSESLPGLRCFAYREMVHASDVSFWHMFKTSASRLCSVDLRGCSRFQGRFFKLFGAKLDEVMLDGCSQLDDETIEDLCTRCCCLRTLKLDACGRISDESLSLISRHLRELGTLTLCGDFPKLSADSLTAHLPLITSLHTLSLDYNSLVSDALLSSLSNQRIPSSLKALSLSFAGTDKSISADGLSQLANIGTLVQLDLSGLAAVNNAVLGAICLGCGAQLKRLALRSCCYLGPNGVAECRKLNNLEMLDLSGCILVSTSAVQLLCEAFKKQNDEGNQMGKTESSSRYDNTLISLVIGGTICEPHRVRVSRTSRVVLDCSDNSSMLSAAAGLKSQRQMAESAVAAGDELMMGEDGEEEEEDEFRILSAHRNFIADALRTEEEPLRLDDESAVRDWATREAAQLGLRLPSAAESASSANK